MIMWNHRHVHGVASPWKAMLCNVWRVSLTNDVPLPRKHTYVSHKKITRGEVEDKQSRQRGMVRSDGMRAMTYAT